MEGHLFALRKATGQRTHISPKGRKVLVDDSLEFLLKSGNGSSPGGVVHSSLSRTGNSGKMWVYRSAARRSVEHHISLLRVTHHILLF